MLKVLLGRVCLLSLLLILGGCSTQFGYRFADTFVEWQLAKYVDLSGQLEDNVDRSIDELHLWHARTQLPRYRTMLDELIVTLDQDELGARDIISYSDRLFDFWATIRNQLEPYALTYLPQLSVEQREQLISNLHERLEEEREEDAELDPSERRRERLERTLERAKEWLGPLQAEQRTLLRRWLDDRVNNEAEWLAYQETWLELFATTLRDPAAPDYADRMSLLITAPDGLRSQVLVEANQYNRALTQQLLLDLYQTLSFGQKRHLRNKLADYRATVDSLIKNFAT
ncbi:DUF6279 family lipoprotein [Pseudidiomarina halophila]|uniref:Lipoprotein n=1 Tax=Pseudidiomarina halophila TaxID=1449799 RepID=A0A432Y0K2_9GAMM|nr:DUF6279 family lipoprotein [Pseudidiomarina halophila]RUO54475.1 hypothetical protein CWI69_03415 [Pseudidiomarina halophila]